MLKMATMTIAVARLELLPWRWRSCDRSRERQDSPGAAGGRRVSAAFSDNGRSPKAGSRPPNSFCFCFRTVSQIVSCANYGRTAGNAVAFNSTRSLIESNRSQRCRSRSRSLHVKRTKAPIVGRVGWTYAIFLYGCLCPSVRLGSDGFRRAHNHVLIEQLTASSSTTAWSRSAWYTFFREHVCERSGIRFDGVGSHAHGTRVTPERIHSIVFPSLRPFLLSNKRKKSLDDRRAFWRMVFSSF